MARRYGRNQKRAHRAELAAVTERATRLDELAKDALDRGLRLQSDLDNIAKALAHAVGPNSAFLPLNRVGAAKGDHITRAAAPVAVQPVFHGAGPISKDTVQYAVELMRLAAIVCHRKDEFRLEIHLRDENDRNLFEDHNGRGSQLPLLFLSTEAFMRRGLSPGELDYVADQIRDEARYHLEQAVRRGR